MAELYQDIPELSAEQAHILRRRRIAEAIAEQSMTPLQSKQIPGGYVVPTSPLEAISKIGQAYLANRQNENADTAQSDLTSRASTMQQSERQKIVDALTPRDATQFTPDMMPEEQSPFGGLVETSAKNQTTEDQLQSLIAAGGDARFPANQKWSDTQQKYLESQIAAKGKAQDKLDAQKYGHEDVSIGNGMWQTYQTDTKGKVDMNQPRGEPFNKRATASSSEVNVGPDETAFQKELGKKQASDIVDSKTRAEEALQIIDTVNTGRSLLDKGMVTGFGADFIVSLGQGLKQTGIDFGGDSTANSQAYAANMAQNVGRVIKQFGAGTGLSDADREYAQKMAGGQITLDANAIRKILDINERQAKYIISRHNKQVKGLKSVIPLEVKEENDEWSDL